MAQEAAVPPGLWGRIEKMIDDRIARFARSGFLRNASITDGGLTLKNGTLRVLYPDEQGGQLGVYVGNTVAVDTDTYTGTGLLIQNPTRGDIAVFRSDAASGGTVAVIRDSKENAVFFTDTNVGQGFGRPWFATSFYRVRPVDWPVVTATGFETVYRARLSKQNPKVQVRALGINTVAGSTGQIRVMVNGAQLGATLATVSGTVAQGLFFDSVAGDFGADLVVEIQARLASGSGGVQVGAEQCLGRGY